MTVYTPSCVTYCALFFPLQIFFCCIILLHSFTLVAMEENIHVQFCSLQQLAQLRLQVTTTKGV
jgi:hypothetical protein